MMTCLESKKDYKAAVKLVAYYEQISSLACVAIFLIATLDATRYSKQVVDRYHFLGNWPQTFFIISLCFAPIVYSAYKLRRGLQEDRKEYFLPHICFSPVIFLIEIAASATCFVDIARMEDVFSIEARLCFIGTMLLFMAIFEVVIWLLIFRYYRYLESGVYAIDGKNHKVIFDANKFRRTTNNSTELHNTNWVYHLTPGNSEDEIFSQLPSRHTNQLA